MAHKIFDAEDWKAYKAEERRRYLTSHGVVFNDAVIDAWVAQAFRQSPFASNPNGKVDMEAEHTSYANVPLTVGPPSPGDPEYVVDPVAHAAHVAALAKAEADLAAEQLHENPVPEIKPAA